MAEAAAIDGLEPGLINGEAAARDAPCKPAPEPAPAPSMPETNGNGTGDHEDEAEEEEEEEEEEASLPGEQLVGRRGATSLRERTMRAIETLEFPAFPEAEMGEAPFVLPRSFVDNDAPLSARKWCVPARPAAAPRTRPLPGCSAHARAHALAGTLRSRSPPRREAWLAGSATRPSCS